MPASIQRPPGAVSHEGLESRLLLASFAVTTLNDSGPGSLRQAVVAANDHAGSDTVTFDHALVGRAHTITLTAGEIPITDPLLIVGPGVKRLTVSGNHT